MKDRPTEPRINNFGQPIGPTLSGWVPAQFPTPVEMAGRYVALRPLLVDHAEALHDAFADAAASLWTYMPFGPFSTPTDLVGAISRMLSYPDWAAYAVMVEGEPAGFACYLRVDPGAGTIEIGSIAFSPQLQRTRSASEAVFLLIDHAFELGYRRCEWKCDDLNAPSRRAADRFGFTYEGTFRQATHYRGRSRDTAWYAIIDSDWPELRRSYATWLDPKNFDEAGVQRRALEEIRVAQ